MIESVMRQCNISQLTRYYILIHIRLIFSIQFSLIFNCFSTILLLETQSLEMELSAHRKLACYDLVWLDCIICINFYNLEHS